MRSRQVPILLVLTFMVSMAMPCFALGPGPEAAMACCLAKNHSDCKTAQLAEQCCRHGQSSQQDRDVQAKIGAHVDIALAPPRLAWTIDPILLSNLDPSAVSIVAPTISPPRNCPLLI